MRGVTITFLFLTSQFAAAQNGYIKLDNDSVLVGFVRLYFDANQREQLVEYWRTKNDKTPRRIQKKDILEYAIKKDTFLILRNFQPFPDEDAFIDIAEATLLSNGKIQYLSVRNPYYRQNAVGYGVGGAVGGAIVGISIALGDKIDNVPVIFALRERANGYIRGVPKKKELFQEVVQDFFSSKAIESFNRDTGKSISFRNLQDFVEYYNRKVSGK
jgi:hypothetical protein